MVLRVQLTSPEMQAALTAPPSLPTSRDLPILKESA
jgi:hypothetical protein